MGGAKEVSEASRLQPAGLALDALRASYSEDGSWAKNTKEILKKGYTRISFLTKLKYAGVNIEDLLQIFQLFIRSCTEYCAVANLFYI